MSTRKISPISEQAQAARILRELGSWLTAHPGRVLTLRFTADGWRATLDEERRVSGGSINDCLAQAATVAASESAS